MTMILTSENYYSPDANRDYFSVSQYKDFLKCPAMAMAKLRGEYEEEFGRALLLGSYVDEMLTGTDESIKNFIVDRVVRGNMYDRNGKVLGSAEKGGIIGEGVLSLCHTNGKITVSRCGKSVGLLLCGCGKNRAFASVYVANDSVDLILDSSLKLIAEGEIVLFFAKLNNFVCQLNRAVSAVCPNSRENRLNTELGALVDYELDLRVGISRELIYSNDTRKLINILDVGNVAEEVRNTCFKRGKIFLAKGCLGKSAMHLKRADGCNHNNSVGLKTGITALDIKELLCSEVCAKARLGNAEMQGVGAPLGKGAVGGDHIHGARRLDRDGDIVEVKLLEKRCVIERRLDQRLGCGRAVFLKNMRLKRSRVDPYSYGNVFAFAPVCRWCAEPYVVCAGAPCCRVDSLGAGCCLCVAAVDGEGAGVGKKLGFIAQEMGREINTLGSKSNQADFYSKAPQKLS